MVIIIISIFRPRSYKKTTTLKSDRDFDVRPRLFSILIIVVIIIVVVVVVFIVIVAVKIVTLLINYTHLGFAAILGVSSLSSSW